MKIIPEEEVSEEQQIVYKIPKKAIAAIAALCISCIPMWMAIHNSRMDADRAEVKAITFKIIAREIIFANVGNPKTHEILERHGVSVRRDTSAGTAYVIDWGNKQ